MKEINLSGRDHMSAFPELKKNGAISAGSGECTPESFKENEALQACAADLGAAVQAYADILEKELYGKLQH